MPIYEFYCSKCNTIYNFFAKSANTDKIPLCPKCPNVCLQRQLSIFAAPSGKEEAKTDNLFAGLDERSMEKGLAKLAGEAEKMRQDDPKAAAQLMRKFTDMTGMKLGDGFQEALHRMEKGEDPDKIEAEMGDLLAEEDPFAVQQKSKSSSRKKAKTDEKLYDL